MKQTRAENEDRERDEERAKPRRSRWPLFVVLAILLIGAVLAGLYCWQMWWRFDDEADMRGEWKVEATGDTIVFDGRNLKLTKSISYEYRLDESNKTIVYTFGGTEGGGHYYFSGDRVTLAILDGEETWGLPAQLGFLPEEALSADTATDNLTVLKKVSDNTEAEPSSNASGTSSGHSGGVRDFVVKPEKSSSSSSGRGSSSSSSSARGTADDDERSSSSSRSGSADEEAGEEAGYPDGEPIDEDAESEPSGSRAENDEAGDGQADSGDSDVDSAHEETDEEDPRGSRAGSASREYYG